MLTVKYSHEQYQNFVHQMLIKFYIDSNQQITLFTNFSYISKFWNADITGIVYLIRDYYSSSTQGAPPKDATAMLRSLMLMSFKSEISIPAWVDTLRSDPFFAILSGFIPACLGSSRIDGINADPIPGIGTFYDFMDRLIRKDRILHKSSLSRYRRKPKSKQKKNQKMDSPSTTLSERLVNYELPPIVYILACDTNIILPWEVFFVRSHTTVYSILPSIAGGLMLSIINSIIPVALEFLRTICFWSRIHSKIVRVFT